MKTTMHHHFRISVLCPEWLDGDMDLILAPLNSAMEAERLEEEFSKVLEG